MIENLIKNPIINQLPNYFSVVDLNSNFLFLNTTGLKWTGFKTIDRGIGMPYANMPCKASEKHPDFIEEDRLTKNNGDVPLKLLGYLSYANDEWKILLAEKSLLKDETGKVIGLVTLATEITNYDIVNKLLNIGLGYKSIPILDQPIFKLKNCHSDLLSSRQAECLFYLIRGKTSKETARILYLSHRTVENYINEIKLKFNCNTKSELIDKAITEGYVNFIPPTIFDHTHQ